MEAVWEVLSNNKLFLTKSTFEAKFGSAFFYKPFFSFAMKAFPIFVGILLSFLLLASFSYAEARKNVAKLQPGQGGDITKNGEIQEEKFNKLVPNHIPTLYKKPFFKSTPHPIRKKPFAHHPNFKRPFPKPHFPPVLPSYP